MKNTPLKDLGWFSFTSDLDKLKQLSIYQAIAYVLRKEADLESEVDEYEKNIHALELESAEEIYEHYGEATDDYAANTDVKELDHQEICIPETEISEDVNLLNANRIELIEHIGAPFSVIYTLLQAEIGRHESSSALLDIQKTEKEGVIGYSIDRKTLDKWKSISTIKELGLLDPNMISKNKIRSDKTENEKKKGHHYCYHTNIYYWSICSRFMGSAANGSHPIWFIDQMSAREKPPFDRGSLSNSDSIYHRHSRR